MQEGQRHRKKHKKAEKQSGAQEQLHHGLGGVEKKHKKHKAKSKERKEAGRQEGTRAG